MNKRTLGVAAVFLAGCAVGGVSSQLAVPKASAQQAALTKWEYFCAESSPSDITGTAAKVGAQGWEMSGLASFPSGVMVPCFKRPKM
jgi:hypothetical protein